MQDNGSTRAYGLGLGPANYPRTDMPGWRRNSVAWHGDDAKTYIGAPGGERRGKMVRPSATTQLGVEIKKIDGVHTAIFTWYCTRTE